MPDPGSHLARRELRETKELAFARGEPWNRAHRLPPGLHLDSWVAWQQGLYSAQQIRGAL